MPIDPNVLQMALEKNNVQLVRSAIESGFDVNAPVVKGESPPLASAVASGAKDVVQLLIRHQADLEGRSWNDKTPLLIAAERGNPVMCRILTEAGASVTAHTSNICQYTALHQAVTDGGKDRLEIVKLLIKHGADVNKPLANNVSNVLMMAAESSSSAIVQELISAGADINGRYIGGTALTIAAENNKPDIVQLLLDSGADPSLALPDDDPEVEFAGKTALEIAKAKKFKKIVAILESHGKASGSQPVARTIPTVAESWSQLDKILKQRKLTKSMKLNPPATTPELKKYCKKWKVELPQDFIDSYLIHDGQKDGGESLIPPPTGRMFEGEFNLLSLEEIDTEWTMWKDLVDVGEFKGQSSDPEKGIRDDWWNIGWIPFASDGGGDSICLDLKPAKGGQVGQIITMNHEGGERKLLAGSFAEWLCDLAESLAETK